MYLLNLPAALLTLQMFVETVPTHISHYFETWKEERAMNSISQC